ncbi:hypothetical protein [Pseudomonas aeruginosa]|uniref:hypothetical protein n=1 Tax=Pseudomonas aeruginosa TaxID=287 RepID=UPI0026581C07|nr:hypothetical protein [Pseudomonas aeruginosa]
MLLGERHQQDQGVSRATILVEFESREVASRIEDIEGRSFERKRTEAQNLEDAVAQKNNVEGASLDWYATVTVPLCC